MKARSNKVSNRVFLLRLCVFAGNDLPQRRKVAKKMRARHSTIFAVLIGLATSAYGQNGGISHSAPTSSPITLSEYKLTPVYSNTFSRTQKIVYEKDLVEKAADGTVRRRVKPSSSAVWIVEGSGGVDIRGGKLRVSPLPFDVKGEQIKSGERSHMVVWNATLFPADLLIEFDMSPSGSTNGLTILFFCAAGKNGEDIFDESLPPRNADYKNYHSGAIANYSDAYWSRNTQEEASTNRLRKNPGFALVAEGDSLTLGPTDVTHHVRVLKSGGHIEIEINGRVVLNWDDPNKPLGAGRIGFRSMSGVSMIAYDNLKVWKVSKK